MPGLDKTTLKASIKTAFLNRFSGTPTGQQVAEMDSLAGDIANAIDAYVKTAQINYVSGLANGAGAVTGTFAGSLS